MSSSTHAQGVVHADPGPVPRHIVGKVGGAPLVRPVVRQAGLPVHLLAAAEHLLPSLFLLLVVLRHTKRRDDDGDGDHGHGNYDIVHGLAIGNVG